MNMKFSISAAVFLAMTTLTNAMESLKSPHTENITPPVVLLSIGGAGRWGLATAEILSRLEDEIQKGLHGYEQTYSLSACFTLIAGTASGALSAAMLIAGDSEDGNPKYESSELVSVFKNHGNEIFPEELSVAKIASGSKIKISSKKYKESTQKIFFDLFGGENFHNKHKRLYIPAFNMFSQSQCCFNKSADRYERESLLLRDVVSAATAPFHPEFFSEIKGEYGFFTSYAEDIVSTSCSMPAFCELTKKYPNAKEYIVISLGVDLKDSTINELISDEVIMEKMIVAGQKYHDKLFHDFLIIRSHAKDSNVKYYRLDAQVTPKIKEKMTKKEKQRSEKIINPWYSDYEIKLPEDKIDIVTNVLLNRLDEMGYGVNRIYMVKKIVFPKFLLLSHLSEIREILLPRDIIHLISWYLFIKTSKLPSNFLQHSDYYLENY